MNSEIPTCPQCGCTLPADAPQGLCPRCLAALNFATETMPPDAIPVAPQQPLSPEKLAPHFPQLDILECLGRGGMGVVYKARQKSLNRLVALKLLAPERAGDAKFAARFEKEAQALAALSHPHIVTIHDFGQAGGFYFLLMEFIDGVNLRQAMAAGRFTPEQALAIIPPVCEALQYAHEHGIVHRDIKPENLLLDKAGRVKIADFGIAKILDVVPLPDAPSRTAVEETPPAPAAAEAPSLPVGTPAYAAPEQKSDPAHVDHRADIYSLGVVLYEMLTGELPSAQELPPTKRIEIDVRLEEVVLRALETRPEMRFSTAAEFRTELAQARAHVAVQEPPQAAATTQEPTTLPVRRPRALGCLAVLGIALGLGLFLGAEWINEFIDDFGLTQAARHHLVKREEMRLQQQAAKQEVADKLVRLKQLRKAYEALPQSPPSAASVPPAPADPPALPLPPPLSSPSTGLLPPPDARPVDLIPVSQADAELEAAKARALKAEAAFNEEVYLKKATELRRVALIGLAAAALGMAGLAGLLLRCRRSRHASARGSASSALLRMVELIAGILLAGMALTWSQYWSGLKFPVAPWVQLAVVIALVGGLSVAFVRALRKASKTKRTGCVVALVVFLGLLLLGFLVPVASWWLAQAPAATVPPAAAPSQAPKAVAQGGSAPANARRELGFRDNRIITRTGTYPLNKRFTLQVPSRSMHGRDGISSMRSYTLRSSTEDGTSGVNTFAPLSIGAEAFAICWDDETDHLWLASPSLLRWHHLPEHGPAPDKLFPLNEIPPAYWASMPASMREAIQAWGYRADGTPAPDMPQAKGHSTTGFFLKIPQLGTLTTLVRLRRVHDFESPPSQDRPLTALRVQSNERTSVLAFAKTAPVGLAWEESKWFSARFSWRQESPGQSWLEILEAHPVPTSFSRPEWDLKEQERTK